MTTNRIRTARLAKGWTQADLARELGVSQQAVQAWETGARDIRAGRLAELSRVLGVTASYLLGFDVDDLTAGRLTVSNSVIAPQTDLDLLHATWSKLRPEMRAALVDVAGALLRAQRDLDGEA